MAVLPRWVAAERIDIDAVEQQVKLLGRQFDYGLLTTGPNEAVRLEPFVTYLGMQALPLPRHSLSA